MAAYGDMLLKSDSAGALSDSLLHPMKPVFMFGATPPREGTDDAKSVEICEKFVSRSRVLAADGFVVYDIQEEKGRTTDERPFPFRRTIDPAAYAETLAGVSGKGCIVYK